MDGNLSREGMTADLEAMKKAGIGGALYLEVGIGIPKGPVEFMSKPWRELVGHAFKEADRLGIEMGIGSGPGWCGTGGPWVKPEESMQHLVASETSVKGPSKFDAVLPKPQPRVPFFGEGTLTPELHKLWKEFYQDVVVLAFPTPTNATKIDNVDEKALYYRAPYSSQAGVKPFLTDPKSIGTKSNGEGIDSKKIVNLTARLGKDGRLTWSVPKGNWTIMRFGRTLTGQTTRPAPDPGLGFESDKFDAQAIDDHFNDYIEKLLKETGEPKGNGKGLTTLHFDSWEMSSQNWSGKFREEFLKRRKYDLLNMLPTMSGHVVDSLGQSERFLWDLRQTAQELVVENHAQRLKALGRKHGLKFTIEPYDLNPASDLELGGAADVPGCEFWSKGYGYSTEFSAIEATSIAHTMGKPVVWAEAFTANPGEDWLQHPGSMKEQGDWALCAGINRFAFHRYQAQPKLDEFPGMTMGAYGVHWERTQTWWDLSSAYHLYLSRCQQMLRNGLFVADILYLSPEGAPNVFCAPPSALEGDLPDRKGYNFDACAPSVLMTRASVKNGKIVFPDGMSYRVLVLPRFDSMTPELLGKIEKLVLAGATVIGNPPKRSPSLVNYPQCDREVTAIATRLWGKTPTKLPKKVGKGRVIRDRDVDFKFDPLASAKWIWADEGNPAESAPVGTRTFEKEFHMSAGTPNGGGEIYVTADNRFDVYVDDVLIGSGDNFHKVCHFKFSPFLPSKAGAPNRIRIVVENTGDKPNPAGLIASMRYLYVGHYEEGFVTDSSWTCSGKPAKVLGPKGMSPWNLSESTQPEIYPPYLLTANVLEGAGVVQDFSTDGSVRYIHRRVGDSEIYFIANKLKAKQDFLARFRVTGKQPEWWDPITGECRDLPRFAVNNGVTEMLMALEPFESGFVVFKKPIDKNAKKAGGNFVRFTPVMTVETPWEVAFDPKWGGPASVRFDRLADWTLHANEGIKYYSGKATYRTTFDCADTGGKLALSLGQVKNLASVKLNGRDLGIVWCAPWRVLIPTGLLKAKGNELEVTVANLWINRLIRDSGLPEAQRLTKTTYNPYRPDSKLQASGLIGPVTILK
jgi:hypothetical protein